jgi:hypothetical protein
MDVQVTVRRISAPLVCLIVLQTLTISAATLPQFRLQVYGLMDAAHTDHEGNRFSYLRFLALSPTSERLFGESIEYRGQYDVGQSSWVSARGRTERIGLFSVSEQEAVGFEYSLIRSISPTGRAIGYSKLKGAKSLNGTAAWIYDDAGTRQIGLYSSLDPLELLHLAEYPVQMNQQGHVIGQATAYDQMLRETPYKWAWIFDGNNSRQIGLVDGEHLNSEGNSFNTAGGINDRGEVIGIARRFSSNGMPSISNQSAWLFDGQSTIRLGLTDELHTSSTGIQSSATYAILDSGIVLGDSAQYLRDDICEYCRNFSRGQTAWAYQNGVTRLLGLEGYENEYDNSYTQILQASPNGLIAGVTSYDSLHGFSPSAYWIDNGVTTTQIEISEPSVPNLPIVYREVSLQGFTEQGGLLINGNFYADEGRQRTGVTWEYKDGKLREIGMTDAAHSLPNGWRSSEITELLHGKYIIGHSARYIQGREHGLTMWMDNGINTVPLELIDSNDDSCDLAFSRLTASNAAGQFAGKTYFNTPSGDTKESSWFYDQATGLIPIEVPHNLRFQMEGMTNAGWLFGALTPPETYPFSGTAVLWHPAWGFVRFDELVVEDLYPGFHFSDVEQSNGESVFVGSVTNGKSTFAFMAVAVPEPNSILLLLISITTLSRERFRLRLSD